MLAPSMNLRSHTEDLVINAQGVEETDNTDKEKTYIFDVVRFWRPKAVLVLLTSAILSSEYTLITSTVADEI